MTQHILYTWIWLSFAISPRRSSPVLPGWMEYVGGQPSSASLQGCSNGFKWELQLGHSRTLTELLWNCPPQAPAATDSFRQFLLLSWCPTFGAYHQCHRHLMTSFDPTCLTDHFLWPLDLIFQSLSPFCVGFLKRLCLSRSSLLCACALSEVVIGNFKGISYHMYADDFLVYFSLTHFQQRFWVLPLTPQFPKWTVPNCHSLLLFPPQKHFENQIHSKGSRESPGHPKHLPFVD